MEGFVFDIQKFALHDGPGIRTAVFLKGCPLRCTWCCNPESQKLMPEFSYNEDKCTGCGQCVQICPHESLQSYQDKIQVDFNTCTACGKCIDHCAENALKIYGNKMSTDEVISEVMKDFAYYSNSGGGMTLTGGEAMVQFDFALDLLKKAKENGIHTAIETSGYAGSSEFEAILPYTDLFLYDYKHTGNELHKKYTGVDQTLILENLAMLHDKGAEILVRCPIIHGINDTNDHLSNIEKLRDKFPRIRDIEILKYHDYGRSKYAKLGRRYLL